MTSFLDNEISVNPERYTDKESQLKGFWVSENDDEFLFVSFNNIDLIKSKLKSLFYRRTFFYNCKSFNAADFFNPWVSYKEQRSSLFLYKIIGKESDDLYKVQNQNNIKSTITYKGMKLVENSTYLFNNVSIKQDDAAYMHVLFLVRDITLGVSYKEGLAALGDNLAWR